MRNLQLEAAIWYLFTSQEFFEAAAQECEEAMQWFGEIAVSRRVADFGRNNQIFDALKQRARDFRRGAALAKLGDYKLIWDISDCIRSDARGMLEQPLHSWMTEAEYKEFSSIRISRILAYSSQITRALNNAMVKGESFFDPDPDCSERANDDDGFPDEKIVKVYNANSKWFMERLCALPEPLPQYKVDSSIACQTGEEVPWTGVWYPKTGLEQHSLTFAITGRRMQPAFRVTKTEEELRAEGIWGSPETVAVATTWHPVVLSSRPGETDKELWAKAGEPCPKAGIWQPADVKALEQTFNAGETLPNLGSAYGLTVWRWLRDR